MSNRQSTKQTATAARPTPAEQTADKPEHAEGSDAEHIVADGETLEEIADKTGVTAPQLQRLNAIKRPDLIWPGMRLRTA